MASIISRIVSYPFNLIKRLKNRLYRKKFAKIGEHTIVQPNSLLVPHNMYLDDYVIIQNNNNFISHKGKLIVKKYSVISSGCIIVPSTHKLKVGVPFYFAAANHIGDEDRNIIIDEDCWIGAGCILLPGCHIGRGAVVGAGSVVTKEIPPYAVAVGVPARVVASKFTLADVLEHENKLYSANEKMSYEELKILYSNYFDNLRAIGDDTLSDVDDRIIKNLLSKI